MNKLYILLFLLISQAGFCQNYSYKPVPDWVKTIELPTESKISKYEVQSGFYLTLADYQVNLEENARFNREVINVVSYNGITNASQISVVYDSSYQNLQIHYLKIWRNGKEIDRTKDMSLELLNSENSLGQGIYTGQVALYDILNDIRKDDLIDFAYTVYGDNPIFENEKYLFVPLEMLNPIDFISLRVLFNKDKKYNYKCVNCNDSAYLETTKDGFTQIELSYKNVEALHLEDNMPSWSMPYKYFTLTSLDSWSKVNDWAQRVFYLENEPKLDEVFNEVLNGNETVDEKINKFINFVQDDVRYMGIESGIGSIKPFPPEQVVQQRYGDCKDKSLLLVSLLKQIGIDEAYPVLVNVIMKHDLDKLDPTNQIFNHCIVSFNYKDSCYWVDPTIAQQGGDFTDMFSYDYGDVLVVGLESDSLVAMQPNQENARTEILDELVVSSFTEPAKLNMKSVRYGKEADQRRASLEYYGTKDLSTQITNELKLLYPKVNKVKDIQIQDNQDSNIVTMEYYYEIDGFWVDGDKDSNPANRGYWLFKYEPMFLYQYLNVTACEERKFDFELDYPLNLSYSMLFHFPSEMLIHDDVVVIENDVFYFETKYEQINSSSLRVDYKFQLKLKSIKAENYADICDQKNELAKKLPFVIYFKK